MDGQMMQGPKHMVCVCLLQLVCLTEPPKVWLTILRKMSRMPSTMRPGSLTSPTMLWVFPLPVAPYANTVAL